jgi:hypothetical protein
MLDPSSARQQNPTAHRHDGPLRGLHRHFSQAKLVDYIRQASVGVRALPIDQACTRQTQGAQNHEDEGLREF